MSKIALAPDENGTGIFTIASPNSNTNRTLTLPDDTGTIVTNSGNQAGSFTTLNTSGAVVFNDAGADVDFRVEGDTNANLLFVDASADAVGIGTNAPTGGKLHISHGNDFAIYTSGAFNFQAKFESTDAEAGIVIEDSNSTNDGNRIGVIGDNMAFTTANAERMRITSAGAVVVGFTNTTGWGTSGDPSVNILSPTANVQCLSLYNSATSGTRYFAYMSTGSGPTAVGQITTDGSNTAFTSLSDYRAKENIAPMTGALSTIAQLNPVTYTWKDSGSAGQGFIAHELQELFPEAVAGEKDATRIQQVEVSPAVEATYDDEGNELTPAVEAVFEEREVPSYQGVDTSFLVATLTAAIKELSAKNDALEARIAALENA